MPSIFGSIFTCNSKKSERKKEEIREIKKDIATIKDNHLYHIEKDVETIKTDIKMMDISLQDLKMNLMIFINKK